MTSETDKIEEQEKRVKKEVSRLTKLFKTLPKDRKAVAQGLIVQAARLRVLLDDAWSDIQENGDYELFTQSENTPSYERERPVAKHFNQRDAAYQKIIMQLIKLLPESEDVKKEVEAELL
ncbi:hypothetical protein ACWEWU_03080 [Staphylococcus xylosus]